MGIFTGRKKKKCEECLKRGRQILRNEQPLAARLQFSKVLHDLDPDNKTELHVWACYGMALSSLDEAFENYANRNTDRTEYIAQVERNLKDSGIGVEVGEPGQYYMSRADLKQHIATMDSDEYILSRLQEAAKYFTATLDLNPISYDVLISRPKDQKIEFESAKIMNIFGKVQYHLIMERGEKHNIIPHVFYYLEPLDLHCKYGIEDARRLIHKIYLEKHGERIPSGDPRLGDEKFG